MSKNKIEGLEIYNLEEVEVSKLPELVQKMIEDYDFNVIGQHSNIPDAYQPDWGDGVTLWYLGHRVKTEFSLCKSEIVDDNFLFTCLKNSSD